MRPGLLTETLLVGLGVAAAGSALRAVTGPVTVSYPPGSVRIPPFAAHFLIGAGSHLAFEALGANRYYCQHFPQVVPPGLP